MSTVMSTVGNLRDKGTGAIEFEPCDICGERVTGLSWKTEILEQYVDGLGPPNDPRRIPAGRARRSVPGPSTVTFEPCGHTLPA